MKHPKEATHMLIYKNDDAFLDGFYYLREDRRDLYMHSDANRWCVGSVSDYFKMVLGEQTSWTIEKIKPLQLENK